MTNTPWHVSRWVREDFAEQKAAERKAAREMQTQIEHAEYLAAKYRPTQEQIKAAFDKLLAEYTPLPFTNRCPTTLVDVGDFEDLKETERGAVP